MDSTPEMRRPDPRYRSPANKNKHAQFTTTRIILENAVAGAVVGLALCYVTLAWAGWLYPDAVVTVAKAGLEVTCHE